MALRHPLYGEACKEILSDVVKGVIEAYGSILTPIEIFGSLSEINANIAAGAVDSYFSLPIRMSSIDEGAIRVAIMIAVSSGVTYDSVHASVMYKERISTIITEDVKHWRRIENQWLPTAEKIRINVPGLELVRPLNYQLWKSGIRRR